MRAARAHAPQSVHCAWPAVAKVCGAHGVQTVLVVALQAAVGAEPAEHCVQLAHGDLPEVLHVPGSQSFSARHESVGTSQ